MTCISVGCSVRNNEYNLTVKCVTVNMEEVWNLCSQSMLLLINVEQTYIVSCVISFSVNIFLYFINVSYKSMEHLVTFNGNQYIAWGPLPVCTHLSHSRIILLVKFKLVFKNSRKFSKFCRLSKNTCVLLSDLLLN